MFRDRFWLSLALTLPVVFWSSEVQQWLGYRALTFSGSELIPAILGTFIMVYGGSVFIQGAWQEISGRQPGMMTLISLAIVVAFAASLAATLGAFEVDVWWELATLISVMLLGHWLEMKAVVQAHGALNVLAALLPDTAERVTESGIEKVALAERRLGDVALVRPGSRVPADGIVLEGTADVDESLITGESRAISKATGAAVVGNSCSRWKPSGARESRRGADGSLRHHAASRRCASFRFSGASSGRPCSCASFLRCGCGGHPDVGLLVADG
jgi:Cu2+-exporting ATPase